MKQITDTVDYTEVMEDSNGQFYLQWHDNVIGTFSDRNLAIAAFNKRIGRDNSEGETSMIQLTMETHYHSETDAVCQLRNVKSPKNIVWGCFFNPQNDTSIDSMSDEREYYLKTNNAQIVWDNEPTPSDTPEQPQQISIEEQMEIWDANTPRWENFPAPNQSAIYVLGSPLQGDTLPGVIIVFNGRRNTVRAYSNTEHNRARLWQLPARYGRIGNTVSYIHMIDWLEPMGMLMPRDLGRLHLNSGKSIYWAGGCAMLFPTPEERNTDQSDWADSIDDSLVENVLMGRLWGHRIDAWDDSMIDPPTKFDQISYDPTIEYPIAAQPPLLVELLKQWYWFNDLCNSAFESGDLDRAENAAVYAYALNGVARNLFGKSFML